MSHLPVFDLKPYKFFEILCVFLYVFESLLQLEKNSWIDREKKRRDREKKSERKEEIEKRRDREKKRKKRRDKEKKRKRKEEKEKKR